MLLPYFQGYKFCTLQFIFPEYSSDGAGLENEISLFLSLHDKEIHLYLHNRFVVTHVNTFVYFVLILLSYITDQPYVNAPENNSL